MNQFLLLCLLFFTVALVVVVCTWWASYTRRQRLKHIVAEIAIAENEFSSDILTDKEVAEFLEIVARLPDAPKQVLHQGLRFDCELAPEKGWEFDDGMYLLPEAIQRRFGGDITDYSLSKNPTLGKLFSSVEKTKRRCSSTEST